MFTKLILWTIVFLSYLKSIECHKCSAILTPNYDTFFLNTSGILDVEFRLNDPKSCSVENLSFWISENRVEEELVEVVDDAAIRLQKQFNKESVSLFMCKYGIDGVTMFVARVGHEPKDVNFTCISQDFNDLICSFPIEENPVVRSYSVYYAINKPIRSNILCNIGLENGLIWCKVHPFQKLYEYTFTINTITGLGNHSQTLDVDPSTIVIPNPPIIKNRRAIVKSRSATIFWGLSSKFNYLNNDYYTINMEFIHRVSVRCNYDFCKFEDYDVSQVQLEDAKSFNLTLNLDFPYSWYDVRIYTRVKEALYGDAQWSNFSNTTFQTKPAIPDHPPLMDRGGFQFLNDNNEVKIFWKELEIYEHNGVNITYEVLEVMENGLHIEKVPKKFDKTMAHFGEIRSDYDYTFKVISRNAEGRSDDYSEIHVPSRHRRINSPTNLKNILYNRHYKLTWDPPKNATFSDIVSYTIFWCNSRDEQTQLCDGKNFKFQQVPAEQNQYTYKNEVDKQKNFAISVNTHNSSSGMTWFPCSATNSSDVFQKVISPVMIVLNSSTVQVFWEISCDTTSLVQGFNITYCAIDVDIDQSCIESK